MNHVSGRVPRQKVLKRLHANICRMILNKFGVDEALCDLLCDVRVHRPRLRPPDLTRVVEHIGMVKPRAA